MSWSSFDDDLKSSTDIDRDSSFDFVPGSDDEMSEQHNVDEVTKSESLGYVNCSDDVSKDESDSAEEIWDLECDTESEIEEFAMKLEDNLTTMMVFQFF